jgi:hypothetical protein
MLESLCVNKTLIVLLQVRLWPPTIKLYYMGGWRGWGAIFADLAGLLNLIKKVEF